MKRLRIP